jgi:heme oxygenase
MTFFKPPEFRSENWRESAFVEELEAIRLKDMRPGARAMRRKDEYSQDYFARILDALGKRWQSLN